MDGFSGRSAPDKAIYIDLEYDKGDPVSVNGESLSPAELLHELNKTAGAHGIGRVDIVENRYVGMKSRGCYETRRHNPSKGASSNRISYLRSRACSPEGRSYAKVCLNYLQWLLVVSGAGGNPGF